MDTTKELIESIPSRITLFDAASDLDESTACVLLPMGEDHYRVWESIVKKSGQDIKRRPLIGLYGFKNVDTKWTVFAEDESEEDQPGEDETPSPKKKYAELVLMSEKQYHEKFVPESVKAGEEN